MRLIHPRVQSLGEQRMRTYLQRGLTEKVRATWYDVVRGQGVSSSMSPARHSFIHVNSGGYSQCEVMIRT
jgi:hypothetical protein